MACTNGLNPPSSQHYFSYYDITSLHVYSGDPTNVNTDIKDTKFGLKNFDTNLDWILESADRLRHHPPPNIIIVNKLLSCLENENSALTLRLDQEEFWNSR